MINVSLNTPACCQLTPRPFPSQLSIYPVQFHAVDVMVTNSPGPCPDRCTTEPNPPVIEDHLFGQSPVDTVTIPA
jgi:hypothetical protein